ncbi:MAG: pyridine nucleotide-disulfide oxidoreductase, partial [Limnospira maxima]
VSQEAILAGRNAGLYVTKNRPPTDNIRLIPGENVAYCVPQTISSDREHTVYMRVRRPLKESILKLGDIYEKKLRYVFPAEMVNLKVKPRFLQNFHGEALTIDILPLE